VVVFDAARVQLQIAAAYTHALASSQKDGVGRRLPAEIRRVHHGVARNDYDTDMPRSIGSFFQRKADAGAVDILEDVPGADQSVNAKHTNDAKLRTNTAKGVASNHRVDRIGTGS